MRLYSLSRRQRVPLSREQVFALFRQPENLARLTPPALHFKMLTPGPIRMHTGTLIDYTLRPFPFFHVRWTTLITAYEPPERFTDVQMRGPYAYWHHLHTFEETEGGTWVGDEVTYALGWGILGRLAHEFLVRRRLEAIFEYRAKMFNTLLSGNQGPANKGRGLS